MLALVKIYFIVIAAFLLAVGQLLTLPIESPEKYILVANAQTNNSANILVPSNMNRVEITLKNDQSTNPSSLLDSPLLVALISAGSAIAGGITGSIFALRNSRLIEDEKNRRETIKELKSKINILGIVYEELQNRNAVLAEIFKQTHPFNKILTDKDKDIFYVETNTKPSDVNKKLDSMPEEYKDLTIEEKSKIFSPESLVKVELAYKDYTTFHVVDDSGYVSYSKSEYDNLKQIIDDALSLVSSDNATIWKILHTKFNVIPIDLQY